MILLVYMDFRGYAHLFLLLAVTLGAVYMIRAALNEPFVAWSQYNEVRAANLQEASGDASTPLATPEEL